MKSAHPFSLPGRRALVTGANRGIGAAIALALAEAGADVSVHFLGRRNDAEDVGRRCAAFGGRVALVEGDLANEETAAEIYRATVAALGGCDILVLNVSIQFRRDWLQITRAEVDQQVAVNFHSSLALLQLVTPAMIAAQWGRILTVGSVQEAKPHPQMLVYSALKSAQTALGLSLAKQLAPHGITVNNLAPGVINTDRTSEPIANKESRRQILADIPMGYIGEPADCAGAALFFCSDAARYVTAQSLFIDGGMSL